MFVPVAAVVARSMFGGYITARRVPLWERHVANLLSEADDTTRAGRCIEQGTAMNRAGRTLPPVVTVLTASIDASTWKARPSASAPSTIVPKKKRAERKRAKAMHEWQS